jgi:hypothetical protein
MAIDDLFLSRRSTVSAAVVLMKIAHAAVAMNSLRVRPRFISAFVKHFREDWALRVGLVLPAVKTFFNPLLSVSRV